MAKYDEFLAYMAKKNSEEEFSNGYNEKKSQWIFGEYTISDERSKAKPLEILNLLRQLDIESKYDINKVTKMINGSILLTAFKGKSLVAFARLFSDNATASYLSEIVIDKKHRGKKLGTRMMRIILGHPKIPSTPLLLTIRTDANKKFFEKLGFSPRRTLGIFENPV